MSITFEVLERSLEIIHNNAQLFGSGQMFALELSVALMGSSTSGLDYEVVQTRQKYVSTGFAASEVKQSINGI